MLNIFVVVIICSVIIISGKMLENKYIIIFINSAREGEA